MDRTSQSPAMLDSRDSCLAGEGLPQLSQRPKFRYVDGFAERVIFREFNRV